MINRRNWKATKAYLEYRKSVDLISEGSSRIEATYLRHILIWAGEYSFRDVKTIRPTLPEHLQSARLDGKDSQLSSSYIYKILSTARSLFHWLATHQKDYRTITPAWIETLKSKRVFRKTNNFEVVTLEEILKIAEASVENLIEQRIRAAAVFWYLSGIRIGAFVTHPISAVDIHERKVMQFPELGVRTKYRKHALTHLLYIPELLTVVDEWDSFIRKALRKNGYWFAPISPLTGKIDSTVYSVGDHRYNLARKNLKIWLEKVGLPYRSPHKFRHGHIHYGIKNADNMADYKAVSMNVMHSNMSITDQIYSRMRDEDVHERISNLGASNGRLEASYEEKLRLFQEFIEWQEDRGGK